MDSINGDVLSAIIKSCRPIDKLSLSMTCKNYQSLKPDLKLIIKEELINRLSDKIDISVSEKMLKICGGVVSGSFILQVLYDEDWNSDIDIIIPYGGEYCDTNSCKSIFKIQEADFFEQQQGRFAKYLFDCGYRQMIQSIDDQLLKLKNKQIGVSNLRYGLIPAVSVKYKYFGKQPINIIYTHNLSNGKYIDFYFDFSVCKNIYNFNRLSLYDLDGIMTKTTQHNGDFNRYRKNINLDRYPGFEVMDPEIVLKEQTAFRIKKYQNYGFTIV